MAQEFGILAEFSLIDNVLPLNSKCILAAHEHAHEHTHAPAEDTRSYASEGHG